MRAEYNLSQDRIERLQEIGFQWQALTNHNFNAAFDAAFKRGCRELIAFKEEFGHCNVPHAFPANLGLGRWCNTMRTAYNAIQKGAQTESNLSQERIERLEGIGFQWQVATNYVNTFEKRCGELEVFTEKFGHCNVTRRYTDNPSLGHWCDRMTCSYNAIQKERKAEYNISQERIERLGEIGFQWEGGSCAVAS